MRICVLTPTFLPLVGGAEVVIDQLVRHWRTAGHDAVVLAETPRDRNLPEARPGYPVRYYPRPRSQKGFYFRALRMLANWHREKPFALIHAHMAYPSGYVACRFGRRRGLPVVITCHGTDVSAISRYRSRPWILRRLRWALGAASAVTAVSEELAEAARELAGGRRVQVLENGVDPALAQPVPLPVGTSFWRELARTPFLLYMKRLHPSKGHVHLLRAFAAARQRYENLPLLVLAGEGSEAHRIEALRAELGIEGRVLLLGNRTGGEKRWLLQNCVAFLHPSEREGMPLAVYEAMICGKTVLAARSEGIAGQICHGKNGFLVEPGDVPALTRALLHLVREADLAALGERAREWAAHKGWDRMAPLYLKLFASELGETR